MRITAHPEWMIDLLKYLEPFKRKVINHKVFRDINSQKLTVKQFKGALINFYPLIEDFPKYMALNLAKVPPGNATANRRTRYWLMTNINQERLHAGWWREFAFGFGLPKNTLEKEVSPPPQMDAINNYLWRICTYGSLAEGIAAANYAVEGPTGEWTKGINAGIQQYSGMDGVNLNAKSLEWITAHAKYDDHHPEEALELIKAYAITRKDQEKVGHAMQRSLEYYALALDCCYKLFK